MSKKLKISAIGLCVVSFILITISTYQLFTEPSGWRFIFPIVVNIWAMQGLYKEYIRHKGDN